MGDIFGPCNGEKNVDRGRGEDGNWRSLTSAETMAHGCHKLKRVHVLLHQAVDGLLGRFSVFRGLSVQLLEPCVAQAVLRPCRTADGGHRTGGMNASLVDEGYGDERLLGK